MDTNDIVVLEGWVDPKVDNFEVITILYDDPLLLARALVWSASSGFLGQLATWNLLKALEAYDVQHRELYPALHKAKWSGTFWSRPITEADFPDYKGTVTGRRSFH